MKKVTGSAEDLSLMLARVVFIIGWMAAISIFLQNSQVTYKKERYPQVSEDTLHFVNEHLLHDQLKAGQVARSLGIDGRNFKLIATWLIHFLQRTVVRV